MDLEELDFVLEHMKFLGCRGTTGTEASFLDLFGGDTEKIDEMNRRIGKTFGFSECYDVCGQTYPRKLDSRILQCLSAIGQSCYRMANDIRLLQHDRQIEEPFEKNQIGSSAMAYKRNPMRCERICSLSRYLMADAANAPMTASVQWLERTLDDSANRRISMPEGFLCADAVLRLAPVSYTHLGASSDARIQTNGATVTFAFADSYSGTHPTMEIEGDVTIPAGQTLSLIHILKLFLA